MLEKTQSITPSNQLHGCSARSPENSELDKCKPTLARDTIVLETDGAKDAIIIAKMQKRFDEDTDQIFSQEMQENPSHISLNSLRCRIPEYLENPTKNLRLLNKTDIPKWPTMLLERYLSTITLKTVIYLSGPPGMGKTTAAEHAAFLFPHLNFKDGSTVVLDKSMESTGRAAAFINLALSAKKNVYYFVVYRDFLSMVQGIIDRALETQRCVGMTDNARIAVGSYKNAESVLNLNQKLARLGIIYNYGTTSQMSAHSMESSAMRAELRKKLLAEGVVSDLGDDTLHVSQSAYRKALEASTEKILSRAEYQGYPEHLRSALFQ